MGLREYPENLNKEVDEVKRYRKMGIKWKIDVNEKLNQKHFKSNARKYGSVQKDGSIY
jgi:predicted transcriptional regulator